MRILVTGRNGQVGWELRRCLLPLGEIVALGSNDADFSRPEELRSVVRGIRPDVIVNAAAYTAVDRAENEESLANTINGVAPGVLAEEAERGGALLVHYSTNYVFDGSKDGPYLEDDVPSPINAYGRSKLMGERAIQSTGADSIIFRTSWVYAIRGRNFLRTMLRLAAERDELTVVGDQTGVPTWARVIAEVTGHCLRQSIGERRDGTFGSGIFNLVSRGETSWFGFARTILETAQKTGNGDLKVCDIRSIATADYPTVAMRPLNSRLSTDRLEARFGLRMPQWNHALVLCMEEGT